VIRKAVQSRAVERVESALSLIHTGIVYRIQVLEVSKLEAIFCNHMRKAGEVLEASKLEAITCTRHRFNCFYIVFMNLHCETEDATSTNPSMRSANWRIIAS
jgi:hypothetical protein